MKNWNDYLMYLQSMGLSPSTQTRQIAHIKSFFRWLKIEGLNVQELGYDKMLLYLEHLRNLQIKETTLMHYLRYVHIYFDYLLKQKEIDNHPMKYLFLRNQNKQRAAQNILFHELLTAEQMDTIYACYSYNPRLKKRNLILLGFVIYQGLATEETILLQVQHLELKNAQLIVPASRKHAARKLPLKACQILPISQYIADKSPLTALISYDNAKQAINSRTALCMQIRVELRRNQHFDIQFKNLNQIRNSRIHLWVKQENLRKAQYLAGHGNIVSTQRFQIQDIETLKQHIEQYHPLK